MLNSWPLVSRENVISRVPADGPRTGATHPPTMHDVAALAGVALATVSRVVNGKPGVSPAMQARVEAAIERLDYRRNVNASSLRRLDRKTATIGLVLEDVANPFMSALHRAVEDLRARAQRARLRRQLRRGQPPRAGADQRAARAAGRRHHRRPGRHRPELSAARRSAWGRRWSSSTGAPASSTPTASPPTTSAALGPRLPIWARSAIAGSPTSARRSRSGPRATGFRDTPTRCSRSVRAPHPHTPTRPGHHGAGRAGGHRDASRPRPADRDLLRPELLHDRHDQGAPVARAAARGRAVGFDDFALADLLDPADHRGRP